MGSNLSKYDEYFEFLNKHLTDVEVDRLAKMINSLSDASGNINSTAIENFKKLIELRFNDCCGITSFAEDVDGNLIIAVPDVSDVTLTERRSDMYPLSDFILRTNISADGVAYRSYNDLHADIRAIPIDENLEKIIYSKGTIDSRLFRINNNPSDMDNFPEKYRNGILNNKTLRNEFIRYIDALRRGTINY